MGQFQSTLGCKCDSFLSDAWPYSGLGKDWRNDVIEYMFGTVWLGCERYANMGIIS